MVRPPLLPLALGLALTPATAMAGPPESTPEPQEKPWIERFAPERNMVELGIYLGGLFPNAEHEFYDEFYEVGNVEPSGHQRLNTFMFDVGARAGYYPMRFFGAEIEGGVMPGGVENGESATLWTVRGHLVGQVGLWSVTPFVLVGAGAVGVSSARSALGNDVDDSFHFGGGVKVFVHELVQLRLDIRDIQASGRLDDTGVGVPHLETILGVTVTLGRKKPPPPPPPEPPSDRDGDGLFDDEDQCPDEPGPRPTGCPPTDRDGDGIFDDDDQCPDEPGPAPTGCPPKDRDGDGILDDDDKCPDDPENFNNYNDEDGCPDTPPKDLEEFTGILTDIFFKFDDDHILPKSKPKLDRAVEVLKRYPNIHVRIVGHTDNIGTEEYNKELARRRANAVREYLTTHGIDTSHIDEVRSMGSSAPVDTNDTREGRAHNRRIEFEIVHYDAQGVPHTVENPHAGEEGLKKEEEAAKTDGG